VKVTEEEIDAMVLEIDEDGSGAGQFVFLSSEPRCFTKTGSGQAQKTRLEEERNECVSFCLCFRRHDRLY
jgi:hypothetical protein